MIPLQFFRGFNNLLSHAMSSLPTMTITTPTQLKMKSSHQGTSEESFDHYRRNGHREAL